MLKPWIRCWVAISMMTGLSACSTIKSWFPDKERDYQFTTEIPELIVPEDLKHKGLASLPTRPVASSETEGVSRYATETTETAAENATQTTPSVDGENPGEPATVSTSTSGSSLQIDQSKTQATRMVGRALSRKKLEVVERNIDKGYFYVKFDPNAVPATDDSIWDELNFMFGDDPSQEQEYRISVQQIGPELSQVIVQDTQEKTLSTKTANALLELITDAINEEDQQPAAQTPAPQNSATPQQ